MKAHVQQLDQAVADWKERGWPRPDVLLVAGSGLGVDLGKPLHTATLGDLLPFEARAIVGHSHGVELLRTEEGRVVLYQRGRLHSYQGYDANQTVFMVRLAALLGARLLMMTNAAGGLRDDRPPGTISLIGDQLNLTGLNPLRGQAPGEWGPQFPDMSNAYSPRLRELAREVAGSLDLELAEGVYAGLAGPTYETPAEVTMLGRMGADLVGMSTVLEVIAARHMGLDCLCFSLISNLAAGVTDEPLDHEEVLESGRVAATSLGKLFDGLLRNPRLLPPA
jgi:purine-nucleoside phosphorylase